MRDNLIKIVFEDFAENRWYYFVEAEGVYVESKNNKSAYDAVVFTRANTIQIYPFKTLVGGNEL